MTISSIRSKCSNVPFFPFVQAVRSVRFVYCSKRFSFSCLFAPECNLSSVLTFGQFFNLTLTTSTILGPSKGFDRMGEHFAHENFYLESINYQSEAKKICNNLSNILLWKNRLSFDNLIRLNSSTFERIINRCNSIVSFV